MNNMLGKWNKDHTVCCQICTTKAHDLLPAQYRAEKWIRDKDNFILSYFCEWRDSLEEANNDIPKDENT